MYYIENAIRDLWKSSFYDKMFLAKVLFTITDIRRFTKKFVFSYSIFLVKFWLAGKLKPNLNHISNLNPKSSPHNSSYPNNNYNPNHYYNPNLFNPNLSQHPHVLFFPKLAKNFLLVASETKWLKPCFVGILASLAMLRPSTLLVEMAVAEVLVSCLLRHVMNLLGNYYYILITVSFCVSLIFIYLLKIFC